MSQLLAWTYSKDATPLVPRGIAITSKAASPASAKLFLNYVYSTEGQQTMCEAGFTAFRNGFKPRNCSNTLAVAKFLQSHPRVAWVNYPGLPDNKYHSLAKKYLPKGASGLLNFGVKGGARAGERFIEAAQFMSHLANIGDAKTLVIHPASTTHRQMEEAEQIKAGVTPDMIRMSVGIESIDDILWDIDQALGA